ncbi:hypothetical protein EMCRGX_G014752 [Ephydatia muelleri]
MRDLEPEFILGSTEEFDTDVCHSLLSVLVLMSLMWLGDRWGIWPRVDIQCFNLLPTCLSGISCSKHEIEWIEQTVKTAEWDVNVELDGTVPQCLLTHLLILLLNLRLNLSVLLILLTILAILVFMSFIFPVTATSRFILMEETIPFHQMISWPQ